MCYTAGMSGGTSEPEPGEATPAAASPPPASDAPDGSPRRKLPLKERLTELFSKYGTIAVITYFTLSILAIIGFSIAVGLGYKPTTSTGVIGVIFTGWALAKATLPIRILITLGLTPMVAHVVKRFRKSPVATDDASRDADPPTTTPRA
jgi:hypothetical protein